MAKQGPNDNAKFQQIVALELAGADRDARFMYNQLTVNEKEQYDTFKANEPSQNITVTFQYQPIMKVKKSDNIPAEIQASSSKNDEKKRSSGVFKKFFGTK